MSYAPTVQDVPASSGMLVGSRTLDIFSMVIAGAPTVGTKTAKGTFVCESFDCSDSYSWNESKNELGAPRAAWGIGETPTGTATLLYPLATANQYDPQKGWYFLTKLRQSDVGSILFIITKASTPESAGSEKKTSIEFRAVINPPSSYA